MVDGTDFSAGGLPLGLMRNDNTTRPAYWAYRTVTDLFAGVTGGSIAMNARTGVYSVTLSKPGATITVALGPTSRSPARYQSRPCSVRAGLRQVGHEYHGFGNVRTLRLCPGALYWEHGPA